MVGSPHGLDGSFHVTRPRADLLVLGRTVFLAGAERMIVRRAGTDQRPIVRLEGSEDRTAAEAMRGAQLLVPRREAPPLEPDEWWAVRDGERVVGTVQRLLALPSCEVLEVARADGGPDLLVPLVRDAVRTVDIDERLIDIDLGFLGEA
jgi:16S rRNA processing protein RimM